MSKISNPLELYKYLNKSNCKECMLPSCMAFAVAVIQNNKTLDDCPHIDVEVKNEISGDVVNRNSMEDDQQQLFEQYKNELSKINLAAAAERLKAPFKEGKIGINCLGKYFWIDESGNMTSECHKNLWVQVPVLNYILHSKAASIKGEWMAFGELNGAADWNRFFSHRCEVEMRKLADAHTDLFFEILALFGAEEQSGVTNSDRSLVIYPLPTVPFMINYWEAEDSFESKLNLLFDKTAEENIDIPSIYALGRGIVEMFRELIVRHSKDGELF